MSQRKILTARAGPGPLSVEQLEFGLRAMSDRDTDLGAFWDENIESFRRTLFLAIRDTSNALLSQEMPLQWRAELESQLEELVGYIGLTDRYVSRQASSFGETGRVFPSAPERVH
jgi:hypothetical protein